MKMNKKGFMLAEVVIVASVVSTVLVFLYMALNRMTLAFDTRNRYYDIDAMYVAMEVNNILVKNNEINNYMNDNYKDLLEVSVLEKYKKFYNNTGFLIKEVYFLKSDNVKLVQLEESINNNQYLKNYISYLKDNIEFNKYNYLIIVELQKKDADDVYFYTLKVGDESEP